MNKQQNKIISQISQALNSRAASAPPVSVQIGSAQKKKKKSKNNNSNNISHTKSIGVTQIGSTGVRFASAPVNVGGQYGPSFIKKSSRGVQAHADFGPEDGSERVEFTDTFGTQVQAGSSTASDGFGGTATQAAGITPNNISPRLAQYEEMYQYYAIRELIVEYCPLISTATSVGVNIGINNSQQNQTAEGPLTAQDLNEFSPSMAGPVYLPLCMRYRHTGTKLFSTSNDSAPSNSAYQGYIFCVLDGSPVASTVYGKLRLSGIVDFYKAASPFSTDPSFVLRNRILRKSDPSSRLKLFNSYYSAIINLGRSLGFAIPFVENNNTMILNRPSKIIVEEEKSQERVPETTLARRFF
jgi:hypothetical protein